MTTIRHRPRSIRSLAGLILVAALCNPDATHADGLIMQLPEDGTSARYALNISFGDGGDKRTTEGSLRVASVGSLTVKGEKCRWIELAFSLKLGGDSRTEFFKLLIPEKQLKRGGDPLQHVVRAWQKQSDAEARPLDNPASPDRPLAGMLAGPLEKIETLPAAETTSKLGKLKCDGLTGTKTLSEPGSKRIVTMTVTTRTHAKAPFGVVTSLINYQMIRDGKPSEKGTIAFRLIDTGDKAVSELPDKK